MEEDKKDLNEQKNFLQLLKQLTEVQTALAKIETQIAIKEGKDQVKTAIDETKSKMEDQAKKFGVSLKNMERQYAENNTEKKGITEEYKDGLSLLKEQYSSLLKKILGNKAQLEADEQSNMIEQKAKKIEKRKTKREFKEKTESFKAEIDQATSDGNFELAKQKIDELKQFKEDNENTPEEIEADIQQLRETRKEIREKIKRCEEEYIATKNDRKSAIDLVANEKNNKLAKIEKQNIFQKLMGGIFNKFNGTKKFIKAVIEPLKAKITKIKEESIPQAKEKVSNKIQKFSEDIKDKKDKISENVKEKASNAKDFVVEGAKNVKNTTQVKLGQVKDGVVTHVTSAVNTGKDTYKGIIAKGAQMKNDTIAQMEDLLEQKQQKLLEKKQLVNGQSSKETGVEK